MCDCTRTHHKLIPPDTSFSLVVECWAVMREVAHCDSNAVSYLPQGMQVSRRVSTLANAWTFVTLALLI